MFITTSETGAKLSPMRYIIHWERMELYIKEIAHINQQLYCEELHGDHGQAIVPPDGQRSTARSPDRAAEQRGAALILNFLPFVGLGHMRTHRVSDGCVTA